MVREAEKGAGAPPREWIAAGFGAFLVIGSIGFAVFEALNQQDALPGFQTRIESVGQANGRYAVIFSVLNTGERTAASVTIRAVLRRDGQAIEQSETTFDYVPAKSSTTGGFIFKSDPRALDLTIDAISWTFP